MGRGPAALVFAPSPLLTVTVERAGDDGSDIHLHPGGQGVWVGRLLAELGVEVTLCASFGGEVGRVVRPLIEDGGVDVRAVEAVGSNGAYVHDRRGGSRQTVAHMPPAPLSRHEVDELYGAALVAGLEADVCVLAGAGPEPVIPADAYRRLAHDLTANGKQVVADLSGDELDAALEGGVTVLKVSHEELCADGRVRSDDVDSLAAAVVDLAARGAEHVVISRAEAPALALADGELLEVATPALEALDTKGTGDSMTAGLAAGLARGCSMTGALRLGAAAGGLNVTRRGLATGRREEIERLTRLIEVRPLADDAGRGPAPSNDRDPTEEVS